MPEISVRGIESETSRLNAPRGTRQSSFQTYENQYNYRPVWLTDKLNYLHRYHKLSMESNLCNIDEIFDQENYFYV